jgi:hypothetical protein
VSDLTPCPQCVGSGWSYRERDHNGECRRCDGEGWTTRCHPDNIRCAWQRYYLRSPAWHADRQHLLTSRQRASIAAWRAKTSRSAA